MNFFDHKNLGNHLLQLCPKVVKHPVYNRLLVLCKRWPSEVLTVLLADRKLTGRPTDQKSNQRRSRHPIRPFNHSRELRILLALTQKSGNVAWAEGLCNVVLTSAMFLVATLGDFTSWMSGVRTRSGSVM